MNDLQRLNPARMIQGGKLLAGQTLYARTTPIRHEPDTNETAPDIMDDAAKLLGEMDRGQGMPNGARQVAKHWTRL